VPTSYEVMTRAHVTYRQLDYWCRRGYARPIDPTPGSGFPRYWTDEEAAVVERIAALVASGVRLDFAARDARR
jgi:DNA-binding transcriptional MerR regulator